jgi:predicted outer membrane repeat protein
VDVLSKVHTIELQEEPMKGRQLGERINKVPRSLLLCSLVGITTMLLVAPTAANVTNNAEGPISERTRAKGMALVSNFHECLRNGGEEAGCRADGPLLHADTARIEGEIGSPSVAPTLAGTEAELRAAWADPLQTSIQLTADIFMRSCKSGGPIRDSLRPLLLDGAGHTIRMTCFEKRLLRQDGTGFLHIKNITLTRGGNDGPGAAVATRGEILVTDSVVHQNLAEEPGGAIFSQRRATIMRSVFTGNFAWDDGGAVYARRGGVEVFDSVFSNNLVDGSGGAIGSTGDILIVRSNVDGNTTDGDGGALYADEDGDITVIDSTVDGNTADGPGGAIFTLEGDVTVVNSTLNGNRADDRGGAISGEADVIVINSTIARNAASAHVGGGIWARSDLFVTNSTISNNYAEGEGGGIQAAGTVGLVYSSVLDNIAPVAANVGGTNLKVFGSVIGPANTDPTGGPAQPTKANCRVSVSTSFGYNIVSETSCRLDGPGDVVLDSPMLDELSDNGGFGETRLPQPGSPTLDRIPPSTCEFVPFGEVFEGEQHLAQFGIDILIPVTTDQRGVSRSQGDGCDVGAVEREVSAP